MLSAVKRNRLLQPRRNVWQDLNRLLKRGNPQQSKLVNPPWRMRNKQDQQQRSLVKRNQLPLNKKRRKKRAKHPLFTIQRNWGIKMVMNQVALPLPPPLLRKKKRNGSHQCKRYVGCLIPRCSYHLYGCTDFRKRKSSQRDQRKRSQRMKVTRNTHQ